MTRTGPKITVRCGCPGATCPHRPRPKHGFLVETYAAARWSEARHFRRAFRKHDGSLDVVCPSGRIATYPKGYWRIV